MKYVEDKHINKEMPSVDVGDTVDVSLKIIEGEKERIQVFSGVVIAIKGKGINRTMTVRRIVANEGVERIIPLANPRLVDIKIIRQAHTRRSKLFFLRNRIGKSRRLPDKKRGLKSIDTKITEPDNSTQTDTEPQPVTTSDQHEEE